VRLTCASAFVRSLPACFSRQDQHRQVLWHIGNEHTTDDRAGNAKIQGLTKDLDMEGPNAGRYNIALFIFFVPYILFEVPSNLVLKKLAPSTWLSLIMVLWGRINVNCLDAHAD
jgi:hypothetical protein